MKDLITFYMDRDSSKVLRQPLNSEKLLSQQTLTDTDVNTRKTKQVLSRSIELH